MSARITETISSANRIDLLLKELNKKRVGISITLLGSRKVYTSTLLQVDAENNTITLDEMIPAEGNKLFRPGTKFSAEGKVRSISTSFESEIISVVDETGLPYFTAAFPGSVEYGQQREHYRVYISLSNSMEIQLSSESGQEFVGQMNDLSQGGAGFSTAKDLSLAAGDRFEECTIQLPSDEVITCEAVIHYYHYSSQSGDWRGGLEFVDMMPEQRQALRACIMEIERLSLRIRPES